MDSLNPFVAYGLGFIIDGLLPLCETMSLCILTIYQ